MDRSVRQSSYPMLDVDAAVGLILHEATPLDPYPLNVLTASPDDVRGAVLAEDVHSKVHPPPHVPRCHAPPSCAFSWVPADVVPLFLYVFFCLVLVSFVSVSCC